MFVSALGGDNLIMRSSLKYKQQVYFEQLVLTKELHNLAGYFLPLKSKMMGLCRTLFEFDSNIFLVKISR